MGLSKNGWVRIKNFFRSKRNQHHKPRPSPSMITYSSYPAWIAATMQLFAIVKPFRSRHHCFIVRQCSSLENESLVASSGLCIFHGCECQVWLNIHHNLRNHFNNNADVVKSYRIEDVNYCLLLWTSYVQPSTRLWVSKLRVLSPAASRCSRSARAWGHSIPSLTTTGMGFNTQMDHS